jgi:GTPase involved in cell partitioning and DNA repair
VVAKKKSIRVAFKREVSLRVGAGVGAGGAGGAGGDVIVEGELFGEIKEEDFMWHLEANRYVLPREHILRYT